MFSGDPVAKSQEAHANASGERQLLLLAPYRNVVAALVGAGYYEINRLLRGQPRGAGAGNTAALSDAGLYLAIEHLNDMFEYLGDGVRLDAPLRAVRGFSVGEWANEELFDPMNLYGHVHRGEPHATRFSEPGMVCSLLWETDREAAKAYADGYDDFRGSFHDDPVAVRVLMDMQIHSALYVPAPDQRSPAVNEMARGLTLLEGAQAQFICPPRSWWSVDKVTVGRNQVYVKVTQLEAG